MFAHATGFTWDEGLLLAAPVAFVTLLLVVARRRVRNRSKDQT